MQQFTILGLVTLPYGQRFVGKSALSVQFAEFAEHAGQSLKLSIITWWWAGDKPTMPFGGIKEKAPLQAAADAPALKAAHIEGCAKHYARGRFSNAPPAGDVFTFLVFLECLGKVLAVIQAQELLSDPAAVAALCPGAQERVGVIK
jgi:hypothetical protein